jgi:hypothetical protein
MILPVSVERKKRLAVAAIHDRPARSMKKRQNISSYYSIFVKGKDNEVSR